MGKVLDMGVHRARLAEDALEMAEESVIGARQTARHLAALGHADAAEWERAQAMVAGLLLRLQSSRKPAA